MFNFVAQPKTTSRISAASFLFIAATVMAQTGTLNAQTLRWIPVGSRSPQAPSSRAASGFAFDSVTQSAILFGGQDGQSILGDTWNWRGEWQQLHPVNTPAARQGPAIAYDATAGNIVLFGGSPTAPIGSGSAFGDTWTWDGATWTQQFPLVSPPARVWSNMAFFPETKTVVLFGGTNSPGVFFDDTWAWDGIRKTWSQLRPTVQPSARLINPLVYDERNHTLVLFGGSLDNSNLYDTWTWDGVNWKQHFPVSSPSPRNGRDLAFDPVLRKVVLFGGAVGVCCSDSVNDTWTWDGDDWVKVYPHNPLPQARNNGVMVYDPLFKSVLLFGGNSSEPPSLNDTWLLAVIP